MHHQDSKARQKVHPIVTALCNGKFQLASRLIDVALDFHIRRKNERHKEMIDGINR